VLGASVLALPFRLFRLQPAADNGRYVLLGRLALATAAGLRGLPRSRPFLLAETLHVEPHHATRTLAISNRR
jgi:hypothetical protein